MAIIQIIRMPFGVGFVGAGVASGGFEEVPLLMSVLQEDGHMHGRVLAQWIATWLIVAAISNGLAASHKDWTAVPLGSFLLSEGTHTIHVARPYDRFGVIASPIVFTAVFDPSQPLASPVEIGFAQDERQLPTWTVRRLGQMYVIGVEPQEQAAGASERSQRNVLTLQVSVKNAAGGLVLMASGTPDFGLLGADALGPLEGLVERLDRGAAREYFNATIGITAGRLQVAQADFTRLARIGPAARPLRAGGSAPAALRRSSGRPADRFSRTLSPGPLRPAVRDVP